MAIDERARHELHAKLEQVLGAEEASTLMAHLPPVGWADVATRRDLDHLEGTLRAEMQATKSELIASFRHELHSEIHSAIRALVVLMSSLFVTLAGVAFAAARLV
jgi:hypothetical protein